MVIPVVVMYELESIATPECLYIHISYKPNIHVLTLNCWGGGGVVKCPPSVFFTSLLCLEDKEPKLHDFFSMGMTHN